MRQTIKTPIVVPENNTTMEPEISALCPALAPIPVARVKRPARTLLLEDLPAYAEATLDAIEPFAAERFDLVIYGCSAAGFLADPAAMPAWWTGCASARAPPWSARRARWWRHCAAPAFQTQRW